MDISIKQQWNVSPTDLKIKIGDKVKDVLYLDSNEEKNQA